MPPESKSYCARLNLQVPRIEDFVSKRQIKLFDLLVVALLEHGAPLSIEAIATRLVAAGAEASTNDMVYSLKKAWHGMEPVYRDSEGRMGLNLSSSELDRRVSRLGLLKDARFEPLPEVAVPDPPPDDVPLTEDEVRWAFAERSIGSVSNLRQAAAVLDALDKPMTVAELEAYLSNLTPRFFQATEEDACRWGKGKGYIPRDAEGKLWLDRSAPEVTAMRRAVRKMGRPVREREIHEQHWKRTRKERQVVLAREREQARHAATRLRRALLRLVPDKGPPAAAALLDVGERAVRTFIEDELTELPAAIEAFDLVGALRVRESLESLGVLDADRFRLVDLKPPQKTRRLNRRGRTLSLTPELLITSTTGISHPLGDPAKIAAYLAAGDVSKLKRRLASDVKALFAFYQYGVIHRFVRLRWGFLDEIIAVDWAVPGDANVYATIRECQETGRPVDLVTGSAPGWTDPWSRAHRVTIVSSDAWSVVVESEGQQWQVPRMEIQAVRAAADPAPP